MNSRAPSVLVGASRQARTAFIIPRTNVAFASTTSKMDPNAPSTMGTSTTGASTSSTTPASGDKPVFDKDGAVGKHFKADGAVGGTADKVGGPFSKDGAIGKHFNADGKVGGTVQETLGDDKK